MAVTLSGLNQDELEHIADVEAHDFIHQRNFLLKLQTRERALENRRRGRDAVSTATNFSADNVCVLCCAVASTSVTPAPSPSFAAWFGGGVRSSFVKCVGCGYKVCPDCVIVINDGRRRHHSATLYCRLCHESREVRVQRQEWKLLCPFTQDRFGFVKLTTPDRGTEKCWGWKKRVQLEMTVAHIFKSPLDDVSVKHKVEEPRLSNARTKLGRFVTEYFLSTEEGDFDLLETILKEIMETVRELQNEKHDIDVLDYNDPFNSYETLVTGAIIVKAVAETPAAVVNHRRSSSVGVQTDSESTAVMPPETSVSAPDAYHTVETHLLNRQLPQIEYTSFGDNGDVADSDQELITNRNWFFKQSFQGGANSISPCGSMRSQRSHRVPVLLGNFTRAFESCSTDEEKTDRFKSETIDEESADEDRNHLSLTSDSNAGEAETVPLETSDEAPYFIVQPQSVLCKSGEVAEFHCQAAGSPPLDVYWYNSSKEIHDQGRFRLAAKRRPSKAGAKDAGKRSVVDFYLQIYDCEPTDSGEIVCLVVNEVSVVNVIALLRVEDQDIGGEEPSFVDELTSTVVERGQPLRLRCAVAGHPTPRVAFFRNNNALHAAADGWTIEAHAGDWSLLMSSATVAHSGQYSVVATNRFGRTVSRCAVSVLAQPSVPPTILRGK